MEIIILNKTKIKIRESKIIKLVKDLSKELKFKEDLTVMLCGDKFCRKLNNKFLKRDNITDVISFPLNEKNYLGDILINLRQVKRQAKKYNVSFNEEFKKIIIHGILHLLGFDHERDNGEMEMLENKLITKFQL